jgi:hypothetical protein
MISCCKRGKGKKKKEKEERGKGGKGERKGGKERRTGGKGKGTKERENMTIVSVVVWGDFCLKVQKSTTKSGVRVCDNRGLGKKYHLTKPPLLLSFFTSKDASPQPLHNPHSYVPKLPVLIELFHSS